MRVCLLLYVHVLYVVDWECIVSTWYALVSPFVCIAEHSSHSKIHAIKFSNVFQLPTTFLSVLPLLMVPWHTFDLPKLSFIQLTNHAIYYKNLY